jgi:hypothetical protein
VSEMEKHVLTHNGLFQAQVCSAGTWDEAEQWIRTTNPAGTTNNWSKYEGETFKPVPCSDNPNRTHYMFEC